MEDSCYEVKEYVSKAWSTDSGGSGTVSSSSDGNSIITDISRANHMWW